MICGRRGRDTDCQRQRASATHQTVTEVSSAEGSAVAGAGVSSVEGFSFSSTPCPLHSGQEFRPLVSHYGTIVNQRSNHAMLILTYLIYTLLVEEMVAFDEASCVLVMFKVTETHETTLLRGQGNPVLAFERNSNK
jgi:hypothetical protein